MTRSSRCEACVEVMKGGRGRAFFALLVAVDVGVAVLEAEGAFVGVCSPKERTRARGVARGVESSLDPVVSARWRGVEGT